MNDTHVTVTVTPLMVSNLETTTRNQAQSQEWFRYKAGRITASRYRQVLHRTSATTWGCQHESDAIARYRERCPHSMMTSVRIVRCSFYISRVHSFIGASPDALVQCNCCGEGVVEVKCPFCPRDKIIQDACECPHSFCLETVGDQRQLKVDHPHYWQCQIQMFCTERSYCDFVLWTEEDIHTERILFNKALIEDTISTAKEFHVKCVLPELLRKWFTRQHTILPCK